MQDKLVEYEINGLYGIYNHKFFIDERENTVILHGPNGVGKTALLKSISNLFGCDFESLSKIPFSQIIAKLNNGVEIIVKRLGVSIDELLQRKKGISHAVEVELVKKGKILATHKFAGKVNRSLRVPSWISRVAPGMWIDDRTGERIESEVLEDYMRRESLNAKEKKNLDVIEETLKTIKVHFVETNRLYRQEQHQSEPWKSKEVQLIPSVKDCAKRLVSHISAALKEYGSRSQELDQSFPYRFIMGRADPMYLDELKERLSLLNEKSNNLKRLGILDSENIQQFDIESLDKVPLYKLEIMSLHIRDSEIKLAAFDSLSRRVQLILGSLEDKFKNKKISLSKENGIVAEGPKGLPIELDALSSGEQHEIVLLYELLFKVSENTLVLIDEPELSLHVAWQKAFLPELLSIAKEVGFSSVIATHSPYIVGSRYDLMTALDSDSDERLG